MPDTRLTVGKPPDVLLQVVTGIGDHFGVESDAGHHQEGMPGFFSGLGAFQRDRAGIDPAIVAEQSGGNTAVQVCDIHFKVPGQQIAGAKRHEPERHVGAGEGLGDHTYGAVATAGDNGVGLPGQGFLCHRLARIILAGFQEHWLRPACKFALPDDDPACPRGVGLDGIYDNGDELLFAVGGQ